MYSPEHRFSSPQSWPINNASSENRPSYTVPSIHHQTLLSKAIYEHGTCCVYVAAVACASKSIQNSSLAPNLLSVVKLDSNCIELFCVVFHPSSALPIQFTPKLCVATFGWHYNGAPEKYNEFLRDLKNTKYFHKSLRFLIIESPPIDHPPFLKIGDSKKSRNKSKQREKTSLAQDNNRNIFFENLENLAISCFHPHNEEENIEIIANHLPSLKFLQLNPIYFYRENNTLTFLTSIVEKITELDIGTCRIDKFEIVATMINLTKLNISNIHEFTDGLCQFVTPLVHLTELNCSRLCQMTDVGLSYFNNLTEMRSLHLKGLQKITDIGIERHLAGMPLLTKLDLSDCSSITDAGLIALAKNQPNLTSLNLLSCYGIKFDFSHLCGNNNSNNNNVNINLNIFPNLIYLNLGFARGLSTQCLKFIGNMKSLEELKMNSSVLSDEHFCHLDSKLPKLKKLDVSSRAGMSHNVTATKICEFLSDSLEDLCLQGCANFSFPSKESNETEKFSPVFPYLKQILLEESITSDNCRFLAENCPVLSHVSLSKSSRVDSLEKIFFAFANHQCIQEIDVGLVRLETGGEDNVDQGFEKTAQAILIGVPKMPSLRKIILPGEKIWQHLQKNKILSQVQRPGLLITYWEPEEWF